MTDQISFSNGTDTGEADAASIAPLQNGERFSASTFGRPMDNLRQRTDTLREEANNTRLLRDHDRAMFMYLDGAPPGITWGGTTASGGTGALVLAAGNVLTIVPAYTAGAARSLYYEGVGTRYPTRYAHTELSDGLNHLIRVLADVAAFDGGNSISVTITDVPSSGAINVDVQGDGTVSDPSLLPGARNIVVTYDSGLGHTIASVISAVNSHPAAGALVTLSYAGAGSTADGMYDVPKSTLAGGLDGVHFRVTTAVLASFFSASVDNLLREGDTLGIYFATEAARRQATQENSSASDLLVGSLVNLSREPEKAQFCVPIGKVIQGTLQLVNGFPLVKDSTYSAVVNTDITLRADLTRALGSPPAADANSYGAEVVSVYMDGITMPASQAYSVQEVLTEIDTDLEDIQQDLDAAETRIDELEASSEFVTNLYSMTNYLSQISKTSAQADGLPFTYRRSAVRVPLLGTIKSASVTGTIVAGAVGERFYYIADATTVRAYAVSALSEFLALTPITTLALADVVSISVCTDTVLFRMSDDTVALYNADLTTALMAKTDLGLTSGAEISHAINRGEYLYVLSKSEPVPGSFQWVLTGVPTSTYVPAGSAMLTSTDTDEFTWLGIDADRRTDRSSSTSRGVYVLYAFDGSGTKGYRVRKATGAGTFTFSSDIGDAGTSPTTSYADGAGFVMTQNHVYVAGKNVGAGGADIIRLRKTDLSVEPTALAVAPADGGNEAFTSLAADSRYIYATRLSDNSTSNVSTVAVYDYCLRSVPELWKTAAPTTDVIASVGSTDETLVVLYQGSGQIEVRALSTDLPASSYTYSDQGRPPLWMHYERWED